MQKTEWAETPLVIAGRAIAEHVAWVERNTARAALRTFYSTYQDEVGEFFTEEKAEPEEIDEYKRLREALSAAQRTLATARSATRRAIKKALAARAA